MIDIIAKLRQEKADEEASPRGCKLAMEEQGKPYPCAHDCPCALRALALTQADRIKALEAQLKATLDREAATYIRHDARIEALEADLNTAIAAAYEAAGDRAADVYDAQDMPSGSDVAGYIRALAPDHARAALDRLLAEARREGWEAAKEAAAAIAGDMDKRMSSHLDDAVQAKRAGRSDQEWKGIGAGNASIAASRICAAIRAMPYDKETKE